MRYNQRQNGQGALRYFNENQNEIHIQPQNIAFGFYYNIYDLISCLLKIWYDACKCISIKHNRFM